MIMIMMMVAVMIDYCDGWSWWLIMIVMMIYDEWWFGSCLKWLMIGDNYSDNDDGDWWSSWLVMIIDYDDCDKGDW